MKKAASLRKNTIASFAQHIVAALCGLILPRMILGAFGSQVNGLTASISQFLGYITLMEAGTGSVMKAAMFKPLADGDNESLSAVVRASQKFFRALAWIFLAYLAGLSLLYPLLSADPVFPYESVLVLVLTMGINSFSQYYFGLTYQLLLQADQKIYYLSVLQIVTLVLNVVICAVVIWLGAGIHVVKLVSCLVMLLRPVMINVYVKKHYAIDPKAPADSSAIKQRWDGLSHHIAYVVHRNTDVAILTLFSSYSEISVYSVYNMVMNAVQGMIAPFSVSITSKFGELYAKSDRERLEQSFAQYETFSLSYATMIYTVASVMIVPFVQIYTADVRDVEYTQYTFGLLIVLAEFLYALRNPYSNLVFAAGKFKGTKAGGMIEAGLNIVLSLVLTPWLGLNGVAIGTVVAMAYRTADYAWYLSKHVLHRHMGHFVKNMLLCFGVFGVCYGLCRFLVLPLFTFTHFGSWILCAIAVTLLTAGILFAVNLLVNRRNFTAALKFFSN